MSVIPNQKYMVVSSVAMGFSALIQNLIRAVILLAIPDQPDLGVLIYYVVSAGILLVAAAMHFVESRSDFAQFYIMKKRQSRPFAADNSSCGKRFHKMWQVSKPPIRKASWMLFYIAFTMLATFTVFPGVTSATSLTFVSSAAWFDLFMVTLFNAFDTIGRFVGGVRWFALTVESKWVNFWGMGRLVFIGTSIMIMVNSVWANDYTVVLNTILLAFTNGYLMTITFANAPSLVDDSEQETVGNLIVIAITFGITVGSLIQIPLAALAPSPSPAPSAITN
jgi:hypothetical protein